VGLSVNLFGIVAAFCVSCSVKVQCTFLIPFIKVLLSRFFECDERMIFFTMAVRARFLKTEGGLLRPKKESRPITQPGGNYHTNQPILTTLTTSILAVSMPKK
jgi:hypothetical protein